MPVSTSRTSTAQFCFMKRCSVNRPSSIIMTTRNLNSMSRRLVLSLKPRRACAGGPLNHLGLRVITLTQLGAVRQRLADLGARIGDQDHVKCCYAEQTKLWATDPDGTLWEVYVLHDDVPDWGEKDKKVKLLAAPFKAFGVRGMIRRAWNNKFKPKALAAAPVPSEDEPTISADSCAMPAGR